MLLPIIKPKEKAPQGIKSLFEKAVSNSVFVAIHHRIPGDPNGLYKVYFEGGIYVRKDRPPTREETCEYAKQAAGRAVQNSPTVAKFHLLTMECIDQIGHVDTETWEVKFYEGAWVNSGFVQSGV